MSERKVLNKYFPPNFDPSKIPRAKKPIGVKDKRHKVRLMAPFSMQCLACREYIYKGKKFNAIKETVKGEMYLTIRVFRFYIRCPTCHAEVTFKTDPQNMDYVAERGAVRAYDGRRDQETVKDQVRAAREVDDERDPLRGLENRTDASKRELEILDALDEVQARNARAERVSVDAVLARLHGRDTLAEDAEAAAADDDEAQLGRLARAAYAQGSATPAVDAMAAIRSALMADGDDGHVEQNGDAETGDGVEDKDDAAIPSTGKPMYRRTAALIASAKKVTAPAGPVIATFLGDRGDDDSGGDVDDDGDAEEEEDLDALLRDGGKHSDSDSDSGSGDKGSRKRRRTIGAAQDEEGRRPTPPAPSVRPAPSKPAGGSSEWSSLRARQSKGASFGGSAVESKKTTPLLVHRLPAVKAPAPPPPPPRAAVLVSYGSDSNSE
ncbi:hypothetical protein BC828DRAFT_371812 [Blastocladiella britannica]|nr:hypothetical protein BC828DRAFT_371812 [Blastocladiella britannica]